MRLREGGKPASFNILIVIICAAAGFLITGTILNNNIIQYASLPQQISFKVRDAAKPGYDSVVFNLPVHSKLIIDTVPPAPAATGSLVRTDIMYHQNPMFPVWIMLILIMVSVASASMPVFIEQVFSLKHIFYLTGKQMAFGVLLAIIIAAFLALSNSSGKGVYIPVNIVDDFHILLKSGKILSGIVVATIILIIPEIVVMLLIGPASDNLFKETRDKADLENAAKGIEMLNVVLRNALQVLSVIVVFSVLTTSALRESIISTIEIERFNIFPVEITYVYGMYFSLFLCITYIPVYFYLKRQYSYLAALIAESEEPPELQQKILGSIDFKNSVVDNLKLSLTVLAPLISSFLPKSLHLFN